MADTMHTVMIVSMLMMKMFFQTTLGHGRMIDPPQRSSMWRFAGYDSPVNYGDNQLFCGGRDRQWEQNDGKCGVCGDPYDDPEPRPNEAGGNYATGVIVKTYEQGDVIDVTVTITANHMGFFVFKLCRNNNVSKAITHECLNQYNLTVVGENDEDLGTKYEIDSEVNDKHLKLQLPSDVTCSQCVLQWTYVTGNHWGCNNGDEDCCLGCGPRQEYFVNCADIAITASANPPATTPTSPLPVTTPTTVMSSAETTSTTTTSGASQTTTMMSAETTSPPTTTPPVTAPMTTMTSAETATSPPPPTTTTPPVTSPTTTMTSAETTSPPPPTTTPPVTSPTTTMTSAETTSPPPPTTTTPPVAATTTTNNPTTGSAGCHAVGVYATLQGMDNWCVNNCAAGFCPSTHCTCN